MYDAAERLRLKAELSYGELLTVAATLVFVD
jgi:hypothetical protein